jgi:hypothetical protein
MNRGKEKRTITLKIGSIYHFMNITYIHLRVKSLNMYMYKMRIDKKLLKNTIIKNVNTYLIKHTYFEQSSCSWTQSAEMTLLIAHFSILNL